MSLNRDSLSSCTVATLAPIKPMQLQIVPTRQPIAIPPRPMILANLLAPSLEAFRDEASRTWDTPEIVARRKSLCDMSLPKLHFGLQPGEIRCVIVPHKGSAKSVSSYIMQEMEVGSLKWEFGCCVIARVPYLVASNSSNSGSVNKTASRLLGVTARGPVIFMLLDHEYLPTHMTVKIFQTLAMSLLR